MRKSILVASLAIAAATISGCQTTDPDFDSGTLSTGSTTGGTTGGTTTGGTATGTDEPGAGENSSGGTGTGGEEGLSETASTSSSTFSPGDSTIDQTGEPIPTSLTSGDQGMAFTLSGQSSNISIDSDGDASGGALVQATPTNTGARVAVDDQTGGALGWPEPIEVPFYQAGTQEGNVRGPHSMLNGASANANYLEFRRIDGEADAELQIWSYDHSYVGQYRVWRGGNAPDTQNLAVFHGGDKTSPGNLPATATYTGRVGATATATNWVRRTRTAQDLEAREPSSTYNVQVVATYETPTSDPNRSLQTSEVVGEFATLQEARAFETTYAAANPTHQTEVDEFAAEYDPNGEWRVTADANLTADFGRGRVTGQFNNTVWKKFEPDITKISRTDANRYITLDSRRELSNPFPDSYGVNAQINGSDYAGRIWANGGYVQGNNNIAGSFYGPNGEETAGVFFNEATSPDPTDGQSPYEDDRRGFVNLRGVFWGRQ